MTKIPYISIVVPVYNEEQNIPILSKKLHGLLSHYPYEILFINDGSTDKSVQKIEQLRTKNKNIKLINLSRNFGHQMAITSGLDFAGGDIVIIMDADLQDPPELIPDMLAKWRMGYDVVYGIRTERYGETFFKKFSALIFYKMLNILSPSKVPANVGDFRLLTKRVVRMLRVTREHQRFLRGMISWMGFRQVGIPYERQSRATGFSKYNSLSMIKLGFDAIFSFSLFPLRIASIVGITTAIGAALYVMYALIITLQGITVKGWSSLVVVILFLGSIQLVSLGVIGEYLGRIYEEIKNRPLYVIDSTLGLTKDNKTEVTI